MVNALGYNYMTLRFILLQIIVAKYAEGSLTIAPKDTVVFVGESTYFNCSTSIYNYDAFWYYYPFSGRDIQRNYIYAFRKIYNPFVDRFRIDNSSRGSWNLLIDSIALTDAGRYVCQDDGGIGEEKSARLIVLVTTPVCQSVMKSHEVVGPNSCSIKPDEIRLSCSVMYSGDIDPNYPFMQWKTREGNESLDQHVTSDKSGNNITYHLTLTADLHMNGSSYLCQTTKAHYNCTSEIINVLYAFNSSLTVNKSAEEEIVCSANSSQSCTYNWKWFQGDDSTTESENATLKPRKQGWHRCEARCSIMEHLCTIHVMRAYISCSGDGKKSIPNGELCDKSISSFDLSMHSFTLSHN